MRLRIALTALLILVGLTLACFTEVPRSTNSPAPPPAEVAAATPTPSPDETVPTFAPTPAPTATLAPTPRPTSPPAPKTPPEVFCCRILNDFPKGLRVIADVRAHHSPINAKETRLQVKIEGRTVYVTPKINPDAPNELVFEIKGAALTTWFETDEGTVTVVDVYGNGQTVSVDPFVYEDPRFTWKEAESAHVKVLYYGPESSVNPEKVLEEAEAVLTEFSFVPEPKKIRIIVYEAKSDVDVALPFRSKAITEELITLGMAFSSIDAVFVLRCAQGFGALRFCGEDRYFTTVRHELVHLTVEYLVGKLRYERLPAWLNEGLAEYGGSKMLSPLEVQTIQRGLAYEARAEHLAKELAEYESNGGLSQSKAKKLKEDLEQAKLLSFRSLKLLNTFPGKPEQNNLSYAQSHSFSLFLIEEYGKDTLLEFFDLLKRSSVVSLGLEDAFAQIYGKPLSDVEKEWVESLTAQGG